MAGLMVHENKGAGSGYRQGSKEPGMKRIPKVTRWNPEAPPGPPEGPPEGPPDVEGEQGNRNEN